MASAAPAAAAGAWLIAVRLVGTEPPPFFLPIAAVVALDATLGQRGSNAVRLLLGAVLGSWSGRSPSSWPAAG